MTVPCAAFDGNAYPLVTDPFEKPEKAVNWGRNDLERGQREFLAYLNSDAFGFVTEMDSESGYNVLKFKQFKPISDDIERLLASALDHLRNSFDQAVFAACKAIEKPFKSLNYPWACNPTDLNKRLSGTKEKPTFPPELWDEIRGQEPYFAGETYPGGNDLVRHVAKLVNDKHTIGFTVVANVASLTMTNVVASGRTSLLGRWDPMKKEIPIARAGVGGSVSYDNAEVAVHVAFDTTGAVADVPAYDAMLDFAEKAQLVLEGFKGACAKINARR